MSEEAGKLPRFSEKQLDEDWICIVSATRRWAGDAEITKPLLEGAAVRITGILNWTVEQQRELVAAAEKAEPPTALAAVAEPEANVP